MSHQSLQSSVSEGAAPHGRVRNSTTQYVSHVFPYSQSRRRRRSPRSQLALLRRSFHKLSGAPSGVASGESEAPTPVDNISSMPQQLHILSINIRCLIHNLAKLSHHLQSLQPHIVLLQETWLDKSIEDVHIINYQCISRRDRSQSANRGGIAAYARNDIKNVVLIEKSITAERCWHMLHLEVGSLLICNWPSPKFRR